MEVSKEALEQMTVEELRDLAKLIGEIVTSKRAKEVRAKPKFKRRHGCLWLVVGDEEVHLTI